MSDAPIIWEPLPGSQSMAIMCDTFELLLAGSRGTGKSEWLIGDFAQDIGKGHPSWRGFLMRPTHKQLMDLVLKSQQVYHRAFPGAKFVSSPNPVWTFPGGERLEFHQMRTLDDYWKLHGHNFDWMGQDELTIVADPEVYLKCMSLVRGPKGDGVPRRVRAATNPSGPGHNWVKERFGLPLGHLDIVGPEIQEEGKRPRRAICGYLSENPYLEEDYIMTLRTACSSAAQLKAWLYGDWEISEGGMFDDLWVGKHHVIPDIPFHMIPQGWRISRSFDWGSASPFSVGWWATSDGDAIMIDNQVLGAVRGDRIRIAEWYGNKPGEYNKGLNMLNTEIARGIVQRERAMGIAERVRPGHADAAIFQRSNGTGISIADDMGRAGVRWIPSEKHGGSRVQGWQQMRSLMKGALPTETGQPRENAGLFICERCSDFRRLIPNAPRDDKNMDDLDTTWEDHIADEVRYELYQKPRIVKASSYRGSGDGSNSYRR